MRGEENIDLVAEPEVLRALPDVEAQLALRACRRRASRAAGCGTPLPGRRAAGAWAACRTSADVEPAPRPTSSSGVPASMPALGLSAASTGVMPASFFTFTRNERQPCSISSAFAGPSCTLTRLSGLMLTPTRQCRSRIFWISATAVVALLQFRRFVGGQRLAQQLERFEQPRHLRGQRLMLDSRDHRQLLRRSQTRKDEQSNITHAGIVTPGDGLHCPTWCLSPVSPSVLNLNPSPYPPHH